MKNNIHMPRRGYLGKVEFHGLGGYREKMLSELLEKGIEPQNVRFTDVEINGWVSPVDYYETAAVARKNGVRLKAGKRRGLYFTLRRYRTRIGLYVGMLAFLTLISLGKIRVRDIDVTGDANTAQVMRVLEECGITEGVCLSAVNCSKAEQKLMLEIPDCAWVDVSKVGFRVMAQVKTGTPVPEIDSKTPCNIVASRPAVILKQTVRNGESVVITGSGVNTGDLLVTGTVSDGRYNILFVHASAEIIGEFTETRSFFVPYKDSVQIADGEEKRFSSLVCGDDEYPLYFGDAFAENSVYGEETSALRIFGINTPVSIRTKIYTAYRSVDITRTSEECTAELRKLKSDYEENFYSGYTIVNAEERFYPREDGISLEVKYTLRGDIAKPVEIAVNNSE